MCCKIGLVSGAYLYSSRAFSITPSAIRVCCCVCLVVSSSGVASRKRDTRPWRSAQTSDSGRVLVFVFGDASASP